MRHNFYEIRAPKPIYFYFSLKIDRLPLFFIRGFTRRLRPPPPLPSPLLFSVSPPPSHRSHLPPSGQKRKEGGKEKEDFLREKGGEFIVIQVHCETLYRYVCFQGEEAMC